MRVTPTERALVVEPDLDTRNCYRRILAPVVPTIEYADDGREALAIAIGHVPGFVITEACLAFIDGYTLCSLLRDDPLTAGVPIVIATFDVKPSTVERARASGADRVFTKPCLPETLLQALLQVTHPCGRSAADATATRRQNAVDPPATASSSELQNGSRRYVMVREHQRFQTTMPPTAPPPLRCPSCDRPLQFERSHIGGVNARFSEQWDYYACPGCFGTFQYRHRTRRLRRLP
jgi:CheY-like chemotaxis protein